MNRDAYFLVRGITVSRAIFGLTLPFYAAFGWWRLAFFVLALAFFTDMIDGPLARAYKVTTEAGKKLDGYADSVLTFFALLALTISGGLPVAVIVVLSILFLALGWIESQLRGRVLFWFVLAVPGVYLALIALMAPRFVQLAYGWNYWATLLVETIVVGIIACLKWWRIADYVQFARNKRDGIVD